MSWPCERRAQVRDLGLERRQRDAMVAVDQGVQALERDAVGVHREQREDLGLPAVEQQPCPSRCASAVPSSRSVRPATSGDASTDGEPGVLARARHRLLDQPRHHPGGRQADRVGAVPGRRQVDHAELASGDRVVHGRRPAHPVVHDRGVVLGREDHRRPGQSGWPGRGRWCRRSGRPTGRRPRSSPTRPCGASPARRTSTGCGCRHRSRRAPGRRPRRCGAARPRPARPRSAAASPARTPRVSASSASGAWRHVGA